MYRDRTSTYAELDRDPVLAREILAVADSLKGLAFIGGGAARYVYKANRYGNTFVAPEPSDIDVFLLAAENEEEVKTKLLATGYYLEGRQGSSMAYKHRLRKLPVQVVAPVAFSSAQAASEERVAMQRFGTPRNVLDGYTFFVEQFAIESVADGEFGGPYRITWTDDARKDLTYKRLRLNRIASPLYATWRIAKYGRKGFKISLAELQRLFAIWDALPVDVREYTLNYFADDVADFYTGLQQT